MDDEQWCTCMDNYTGDLVLFLASRKVVDRQQDMALCACKCLNIRLRISGDTPQLARFADGEQRDPFFREELVSCASSELVQEVTQPALVSVRHAGAWTVHACLACGAATHATGPSPHLFIHKATLELVLCVSSELVQEVTQPALVSVRHAGTWTVHACLACGVATHATGPAPHLFIRKATVTTQETMDKLKNSPNFSPVFKLLVPEISAEEGRKENVDGNTVPSLSEQLSTSLQSELKSVEDSVRLYADQKYAEYEHYKEQAHKDHHILASIVKKARAEEEVRRRGGDLTQLSPPPFDQQRRRLSSFKDVKKLKHNVVKNARNVGSEDDSLDSEDIFDLEGEAPSRNGNNSDADDYDSEDSGSNDEGIQVRGRGPGRAPPSLSVARSLPMNVPKFSNNVRIPRQEIQDEEEPRDIAASIKALARSVHAEVFGDLPRPRFSTQI